MMLCRFSTMCYKQLYRGVVSEGIGEYAVFYFPINYIQISRVRRFCIKFVQIAHKQIKWLDVGKM